MFKRQISVLLCLVLLFSVNTLKSQAQQDDKLIIAPNPQRIVYSGDSFELTAQVNIIGAGDAETRAVDELKRVLDSCGINYVTSDNMSDTLTNIIIGEYSGDEADDYATDFAKNYGLDSAEGLSKDEGYIIYSSSNDNGTIAIIGINGRGTYYGVKSFKQILFAENGTNMPVVFIDDYPSIEFRGVVEGFYGEQWSHENRKSIIAFMGEHKMNTYIYGPKDDPYHRDYWRLEYPAAEAAKIQELVNTANKNMVDFYWAIHPGLSITFTEGDYNALLNKCLKMYDLGVRAFAVFFDDISGTGADPTNQANFLNRLNNDLVKAKGDIKPLILCPTEYNKAWANPNAGGYLDVMGNMLDPSIHFMWTGDNVMSDISKATLEWVNSRVKRNVFVWWNYPVNDYCRSKLLLGRVYGLSNDVDNAAGFVSNPMNQAQASKIALYGVADYTWNVTAYDYEQNWHRAIEAIVPEVAEDFKIFAANNGDTSSDRYRRAESEYLKPLLDAFRASIQAGTSIKTQAQELVLEFRKMSQASVNILANTKNKALLDEITPWLNAFEQLGIAGECVMKSLIDIEDGNMDGWWINYLAAKEAIEEMERIDEERSEGVQVATLHVQPFVLDMLKTSEDMFNSKLTYRIDGSVKNLEPFSSYGSSIDMSAMVDNRDSTYAYIQIQQVNGDYYGVDLGKLTLVHDIRILQGRTDTDHDIFQRGVLEYSTDGNNWTAIGGERSGYKIVEEGLNVTARYIRYRLTHAGIPGGKPDLWTAIRDFSVNNLSGIAENYTNIKELSGLNITKDETGNSLVYPSAGDIPFKADGYFGIRFPDLNIISGIRVKISGNDSLNITENIGIQWSYNGIEWEDIDVQSNDGTFTGSGQIPLVYLRVINKGTDDLQINIDEFTIELPAEAEASTNAPVYSGSAANLIDGNLQTLLWTKAQSIGQYYLVDLGASVPLYDISVYQGTGDYIRSGKIEVSNDATNWTELEHSSEITSSFLISKANAGGNAFRYIRVLITGESNYWTQLYEITWNETVPEEVPSLVTGTPTGDLYKAADGRINTAYIAQSAPQACEYITYRLSDIREISAFSVLQSDNAISGATVEIRTLEDGWKTAGILNKAYNLITLDKPYKVLEIKLLWQNNGVIPEIYEIVTNLKDAVTDDSLKVLLETDGEVYPGEEFSVSVKIENAQNIIAHDLTFSYNPENLEFLKAESASEGIEILAVDSRIPGTIRIASAGTGLGNVINGDKKILKLTFRTVADFATETIFFDSAQLSNDSGDVYTAKTFGTVIAPKVEMDADVNKDGRISIADLGIVAWYYGVREGDNEWAQAKAGDMDHDGIISIMDLSYIAGKIISAD
mgnify:CR=1 FL=1